MVIPPTLQALNSAFQPPISHLLDLRMAVRGVYANNVGMTRMNPEQMEINARGTRSTQEIISERQREFRLENNSANFEYMMWTNLHREIFRRAVAASTKSASVPGAKEAKAFRDRCLRRGVPPELLDEHADALVVEVNRAIGGGSPDAREATWGKLMQLRGAMDEAGRRHTERQFAAALIGYGEVDEVFPLGSRDQIPTNEKSIATLENNDFREGAYVPAGSDQLHVAHLGVHFQLLGDMAKSFDEAPEQADHDAILRTFQAGLPNCQEHIQFLSGDETRKDFVKKAGAVLQELAIVYKRVEKAAAEGRAAQEKIAGERQQAMIDQLRGEMDREGQIKLRKVELDAQLEQMRQQSLAATRQWAKEQQEQIKRESTETRAQLEREMAERRMALEEEIARRKQDLEDSKKKKD
jgi:hypothetical protein